MQSLAVATPTKPLTQAEQLQLLELEDLELQLLQEERRRQKAEETTPIVRIENKHKAFIAAYPLQDFIQEAFPIIEQGREFHDTWHISVICELLQSVIIGDVKNFIINQPRRTLKSILFCVMFPCWVWTFLPHLRFLYTSYTEKFAKRDNRKSKMLINSPYYNRRFGHMFALTSERADFLENTAGGFRAIFMIGGGTGEGGDFVFADDPNNIKEIESETTLEKTNQDWDEISYHNVSDRRTAVRGIVQQRSAPNDLTGHILDDKGLKDLYTAILVLPMRYESDHPTRNCVANPLRLGTVSEHEKTRNPRLAVGEEKLWIDPRDLDAPTFQNIWYRQWYKEQFTDKGLTSQGDGQMLLQYIPKEIIDQEIAHLKGFGEAGQYQQRPYPRGGQFFDGEKFTKVSASEINLNNLTYIRYWDKAGSDASGDWTVGILMARTKKRPFTFYILEVARFQKSYFERMAEIKRIAQEDYKNYVESKTDTEYTVGIEREGGSSGKDVSLIEKEELLGFDVWIDFKKQSKEQRAKLVRQRSEGGFIKVVANSAWNNIFFKRLEKFDPKKKNQKDDEIDSMTGAFYYLSFMSIQQHHSSGSYM